MHQIEHMTTREAAERLNVHPRTVARLVEREEITPSARLALGHYGAFLFDPVEVDRVHDLRAKTTETAK